MRRTHFVWMLTIVVMFAAVAVRPFAAQQAPAADKAAAALAKGETALRARAYDAALEAFKQANSLLNKASSAALYGMARSYHGLGAFKSEVESCTDALKVIAPGDKLAMSIHNQRGLALVALSDTNGPKALKDAEAEFRAVLDMPGASAVTGYNLGVVLLKQNRDDEGIVELKKYVDTGARTPEADTARAMMVNPRRAREPYAPIFRITTLESESVNLEDLTGKVVVLDFWGTWCGPCVAAVPSLVDLSRKYARRPVNLIGISSDGASDRQKVLGFVAANKMTWPEYIDGNRQIERIYDVHVFPTWIVVNAEGIVQDRIEGWGPTSRGDIDRAIDRALKTVAK